MIRRYISLREGSPPAYEIVILTSSSSPGLKVGDRAVYSCEPGYGVVGEEDRTCGQDGKWSGPDPYCKQQGE